MMEEASDPPHSMGYGAGAFYVYEPLVGGCGLVGVAGEDGTEGAPVLGGMMQLLKLHIRGRGGRWSWWLLLAKTAINLVLTDTNIDRYNISQI